jgi:hypothetical protein
VCCAPLQFSLPLFVREVLHMVMRVPIRSPLACLCPFIMFVCVCVCVCLCLCVRAHVCCVSLNHAKSKASEHVRLLHYFTACIKVHPSHVLGNQALELHEAHRHLPPSSSWMVSMHNM